MGKQADHYITDVVVAKFPALSSWNKLRT